MRDTTLGDRIHGLSTERQALLSTLLKTTRSGPSPSPATSPAPPQPAAPAGDAKALCQQLYDALSHQLNSGEYGEFSYFLNYGYISDGSPEYAAVELPEHYIDRNSVKLALELIGDSPISTRRVLDVGCGRGGLVHVLSQFFTPAEVTGIDLSPIAIEFCQRAHRRGNVRFEVGDAEALPFPDNAFDVVTNLESSSCYPDWHAFYAAVYRVLAPGGDFLYSDCLPRQRVADAIAVLTGLGFELERDRDITSNVLASCAENARRRLMAYGNAAIGSDMENFLAAPGSRYYEEMRQGLWTYRILKLRKPAAGV